MAPRLRDSRDSTHVPALGDQRARLADLIRQTIDDQVWPAGRLRPHQLDLLIRAATHARSGAFDAAMTCLASARRRTCPAEDEAYYDPREIMHRHDRLEREMRLLEETAS